MITNRLFGVTRPYSSHIALENTLATYGEDENFSVLRFLTMRRNVGVGERAVLREVQLAARKVKGGRENGGQVKQNESRGASKPVSYGGVYLRRREILSAGGRG